MSGHSSLSPLLRDQQRLAGLLRTRFDWFAQYFFPELEPDKRLVKEPYLEALCYALQDAAFGDRARLLINMPPRHLKSFCAAVCLPAFVLGLEPATKVVVASYGGDLAREHIDAFRRLILSPAYRAAFPAFRLSDRGNTPDKLKTTRNGGYRAVTVGGALTGFGADLLIVDDLLKAQDAASPAMREEAQRFFSETALTRFDDQRSSRIIVIQQRLHPNDISAELIEQGVFRSLVLPSIAACDLTLPLYDDHAWLFCANALLSPERFSHQVLDNLKREMGVQAFSAQYLQEPLASQSMLVDMSRLHLVGEEADPRPPLYVVQSIDTAVKIGERCNYTVITTWGFDGVRWRLLDLLRERLEFPDLKLAALRLLRHWKADRVIIEDSHTGAGLGQELRGVGPRVQTVTPRGDKVSRLSVAMDLLYSGDVVIPCNLPWWDAFRREMIGFPNAAHDDIVDSVSQFINWLRSASVGDLVDIKYTGRISRPVRRETGRRGY